MTAECPLRDWLEQRRAACRLSVRAIPWRASTAWRFERGRLAHATGGFFSVVGIRSDSSVDGLDGLAVPIIDQPEVGILGFVVRARGTAHEWLIQAKAEPGNIGAVQLAPTVQATRSNFTRLHGGGATPCLDCFTAPDGGFEVVADSLQSEHGNRFLGKYNRNMTLLAAGDGPDPGSADWRWAAAAELRTMLASDFAVNTDARSVLFCSDWRLLADGVPFSRWRGACGWGASLLASFEAEPDQSDQDVRSWLAARRAAVRLDVRVVPLESMPEWELTADSIAHRQDGRPLIRAYEVRANSREVERWDQPLVLSHREEAVTLVCQRRGGALRFLMRASAEAGFRETVQLGPTWQSDDVTAGNGAADKVLAALQRGQERDSRLQSDEGGRFFHSVSRYRIVELPETEAIDLEASGYLWMDLGQICRLAGVRGMFTNEARSVLSMLLAWL